MKYYVITSQEFTSNHESNYTYEPIYSLDGTLCIIDVEDSYLVENYVHGFEDSNALNGWRFDTTTEEWRNWMTEEEYNQE